MYVNHFVLAFPSKPTDISRICRLGTVASVMMNGTCCLWQMQREEERRENLRRDFRMEYERHRLIDRQLQRIAYEQQNDEQELSDRRQRIMAAKSAALKDRQKKDHRRKIHSERELLLLRDVETEREECPVPLKGAAGYGHRWPPRARRATEPHMMSATAALEKGRLVCRNTSSGHHSDHSEKSSLVSIPL